MQQTDIMRGFTRDSVDVRASALISGVYVQMTAGILLTALVAYALIITGLINVLVFEGGSAAMWGVIILQFGTVMMFGPMARSQSAGKLKALFFFYAAITGITVDLSVSHIL